MTNFQLTGREWWVERWLELLDSYRFKKRLERGRNYAREGNVLSIDIVDNEVLSLVQGSEAEPYQVRLSLEPFKDENQERALKMMSQPPFNEEDWDCVIKTMSEKAIFSAQLLAGEMPKDIEQVFTSNGLSLFPYSLTDVRSRCTCPDKANPCKHIAAVYYQLGDRFSEDPFLIFRLRGRSKEQILSDLRQVRSKPTKKKSTTNKAASTQKKETASQTKKVEKSTTNVQQFWQYNKPLDSSLVTIVPPTDNKTVLDILGNIPLMAADAEAVQQYLTEVYQTTSQKAVIAALNRDS
ncbi:MAG: SWIM zinc finger family protein [Xenococcaceae cyanobacterium MO_234.B1]|nr:SWIM zinc finger family protein [Xenococcaceae cyanobacterium MO_234.B1]